MQIQNVSSVGIAARMSLRVGRLLAPAVMATLLSLGAGRVAYAKEVQVDTRLAPPAGQATLAKTIGDKLPKKLEKEKKDGGVVYTGKYKVEGAQTQRQGCRKWRATEGSGFAGRDRIARSRAKSD